MASTKAAVRLQSYLEKEMGGIDDERGGPLKGRNQEHTQRERHTERDAQAEPSIALFMT